MLNERPRFAEEFDVSVWDVSVWKDVRAAFAHHLKLSK